ncbi:MAG: hypothetical protein EOP05_09110 [Proteobacteria bacterium]|nr:MAG: hypothetical protein EOP05_19925 [Pseudomonadota bacterium]RYZ74628.1 MAG: hypothetical protein EOP05_09110 [Pseudomonadota bacterium]
MLQLNPSIPVETPKGKGQAVILIDYSTEHDLYWVVFLDESRECWTFNNRDVRIQENFTLGRPKAPANFAPRPAPSIAN